MSNLKNRIRHGDLNGIRDSIRGGVNLALGDKEGNTPLHVAAQEDAIEVATILIMAGAPLEALNAKGKAPSDMKPGSSTTAAIEKAIFSGTVRPGRAGLTRRV